MPDALDDAPRLDAPTFGWAAACAAATLPLIVMVVFRGDLGTDIVSDPEAEEVLWIIWHLQTTFHRLLHTDGVLAAVRYALLDGYPYFGNVLHFWVLSIPLRELLPFPLWFNMNTLVVETLNAFGAAVLAITLTRSRAAGLLAAIAMALNPYTLMLLQRGRHRDVLFVFVGLFLAALVRAAATDRVRDHVTCGLWLAVAGLFYWFNALFGALCLALWTLARALAPRGFLIAVGLAIVLCLPFAAPFYGQGSNSWRHFPWLTPLPSYEEASQIPISSRWNGIDGRSVDTLFTDGMSAEWIVGLPVAHGAQPLALLLLALTGACMARRRALPWIATGVVFYVAGLGPNLRLHETTGGVELPYRVLFRVVPFLSRLYHPRYAALFTLYSLLALGALAVAAAPTRRLRLAVCGLGVLSIVGGAAMAPPMATVHVEIPAFYASLADRAPGALVELPCYRAEGRQAGRSFYETLHDREVIGDLGGYGREPGGTPGWQTTRVLFDSNAPRFPSASEFEALVSEWRAAGARFVVLHQTGGLADPRVYGALSDALTARLGPPVHEELEQRPFTAADTASNLLRVWKVTPP